MAPQVEFTISWTTVSKLLAAALLCRRDPVTFYRAVARNCIATFTRQGGSLRQNLRAL